MSQTQRPRQTPIAIVGISALMPGSTDITGLWRNILEGNDLITDVPPARWLVEDYYDPDPFAPDKTYCRRGAFLGEVDFDSMAFGIPPNTLASTDTAQLLALVAAEAALADATGGHIEALDRERVGVILGVAQLELAGEMVPRLMRPVLVKALREQGLAESRILDLCDRMNAGTQPWTESTFPGLLGNVVAGRVANRFDLHGTNCTTDAACASSFAALSMAADELALGRADLMLTGGVDTLNDIFAFMCFSKTPALSLTGDCRPFSEAADGTMLGEGLVMFALKRLADAESDEDQIYAVITGIGSSSDGKGTSIYAPVAAGQARALRRAYASAGHGPDTVELVEAHGTGTIAGDVTEFESLRAVFDATGRTDRQWCALGSVKSQYGHTKTTAGALGLLKAVLALRHKVLPPTIKVERPDPRLDLANSPLYLNTRSRPWIANPEHPRRAGVSSFGFGGTNFHVTVEEYTPSRLAAGRRPWRDRAVPTELVLLSADNPTALRDRAERLTADRPLADLARTSLGEFHAGQSVRLAVVSGSMDELREKLARATELIEANPDASFAAPTGMYYGAGEPRTGRIAYLFPGQGSQYPGMGADLAMHLDLACEVWDHAERRVPGLRDVVFPIPAFTDAEREAQAERLTDTEWAQPALAAHSLALLEVLQALGLRPDCVAGHSFGELTALCAAGIYDPAALLRLARVRGELMREAAETPGAMLAVLADAEVVEDALTGAEDLWLANHNGPGEFVVSGTREAVAAVRDRLAGNRVTVRELATAAAFHSPLVAAAGQPLAEHLAGVQLWPPSTDVYGNADAALYPVDPEQIRGRVASHLGTPVRWADTIEAMYADGVRTFVEVGPGGTLTALVPRILGEAEHTAIRTDGSGVHGITGLHRALGQLAAQGVPMTFEPLWENHRPVVETVTDEAGRRPKMITKITGRNLGRTYPPAGGAAAIPPPNPDPEKDRSMADESTAVPSTVDKSTVDGSWIRMVQRAQTETAEAHSAYQRAMAESHVAYLKMAETSMNTLADMVRGGPLPALLEVEPAEETASRQVAETMAGAHTLSPTVPELVVPQARVPADAVPASGRADGSRNGSTDSGPSGSDMLATLADIGSGELPDLTAIDVQALIVSIVADRTGYPPDMIDMDLDIDTDLGIDSIKRVEIMASLRAEIPWLPDVSEANAAQLAEAMAVRTIGEIVERTRVELAAVAGDPSALRARLANGAGALSIEELIALTRTANTPAGRAEPGKPDDPTPSTPSSAPAGDRPEASSATDRTPHGAEIARMVVRAAPTPAEGVAMAHLGQATLAVTDEGTGVAQAVVTRLTERGIAAEVVSTVGPQARAAVFLDGLREVASVDEAIAVQRAAFRAVRALASDPAHGAGLLVTVQDTGGDFGLRGAEPDRAWLGGLAALARTAAREWPGASVKAIDCERAGRAPDAIAAAIVEELCAGGPTPDVGLRADGSRHTLITVAASAEPDPAATLGPDPVIVVSGGARGVTAAGIRALAGQHRARLVLLGRTPLVEEPRTYAPATDEASLTRLLAEESRSDGDEMTPRQLRSRARSMLAAREVRQTLAILGDAGVPVRYVTVDVTDRTALEGALAEIRRDWGPITGLVHGAGVLADKTIAEKTDEAFDTVFDTKVAGLRALLAATASDPLRLLCAFSSVVSRYGNAGQCDYAMANETLNQVLCAEAVRRAGCAVRSLLWGPWHGGMVAEGLAELFGRSGVTLIDMADGARAFTAELTAVPRDVQVVLATRSVLRTLAERAEPASRAAVTRVTSDLAPANGDGSLPAELVGASLVGRPS